MGTYIHFTDEEKHRANEVDLVDFLQHQGERLLPSGREKRLASDHSITVRGNEWYDHAIEKGGYAIEFVKTFYGLSYPEAVQMLLGGVQGIPYRSTSQTVKPEKKSFALPPANKDMRRAYEYLLKKRGLNRDVVEFFVKKNLLYESCERSDKGRGEYHNVIFVGVDETGTPCHAQKHGLYTHGKVFKGNVEGCSSNHSFHHVGTSNRLYVFESPIDMLSFLSLHLENWERHSYVALCGVSSQALLWMLETYPHLQIVALCLDNDTVGHKACARLETLLVDKGYKVERHIPKGKDWNEDVRA
ncbi:DUF3991 and toprim domain-containing protein [Bengtsoniella intestinalis]|uniref:DUF3991 and toprim domain-containing protein n=1 Tax=Bengtsoniella intestinalis TaxID=3073143 RepID=UPI00391F2AF8